MKMGGSAARRPPRVCDAGPGGLCWAAVARTPAPTQGNLAVSLADIQAVIASAKSRGIEPLERFVRERLHGATEEELEGATELALELIESVPLFLARAAQEAEERQLTSVIGPILAHVERYFLEPIDLIPEMTYGLAGLLDDAYLVLRILENLDRGPDRFLDWDLAHPLMFLRRLVGEDVARKLDARSLDAMHEISSDLRQFWDRVSLRA
jgi:uncharacterized membrane protein YkvA (DUF1232 family)